MGKIEKNNYKNLVNDAVDFISGKSQRIQKNLSKEMEIASGDLDYEKAAILRDRIKALTQIQSSQKINQTNLKEADVISIFKESGKTCVQVFFFRSKQNWGNQAYFPKHDPDEGENKILSSFLGQFYENKSVPKLVLLNQKIEEEKLLEKTFSEREKKEINIREAKTKEEKIVSKMAEKNAKQSLTQKILETESNSKLIDKLADKFNLKFNVNLIEVYDNSHIQGTDSVGALITFGKDGFIKKRYRKFNIKSNTIKSNDYGMMREVLKRRFSRALKEESFTKTLPDLVLIDGGKGQYSVSRETLNDLGLHELPIIAIAKGKNRNAGDETFFYDGKTFKFKKNDPTLFFLQRLRDESHRFAISTHRAKRRKNLSKSLLDQISGIGRGRKRALLNHFGSAKSVEAASFEDLKSVEGIEEKVAKKIHDFFHDH